VPVSWLWRRFAAVPQVLLALVSCSEGPANDDDARSAQHCPTGGDPQPEIAVWQELTSSSTSTTPTQIEVCLNQNIDRLLMHTQIFSVNDAPVTSCITHEVLRIGGHAVEWETGTVRAFPLNYPEDLPAGNYVELVSTVVASVDADILASGRTGRFFKVDSDGTAPISSATYSNSSTAGEIAPAMVERCPDLPPYGQTANDEVPANETITVVNFDDWSSVATVQPIRHDVIDVDAPRSRSSTLRFSAWNAKGDRVRLTTEYMPQAGSVFETSTAGVSLQTANHVDWHSRSGLVTVTDQGAGIMEITLSGIVLEKGRTIEGPIITRVTGGTISGSVRRRCQAPSWNDSDSSWSPEYCDQIRRTGGF
jgi:hypothetical protein